MKVGDLVKVKDRSRLGIAFIIEIDEPSVQRPYQVATLQFDDGIKQRYVTTALQLVSEGGDKNET